MPQHFVCDLAALAIDRETGPRSDSPFRRWLEIGKFDILKRVMNEPKYRNHYKQDYLATFERNKHKCREAVIEFGGEAFASQTIIFVWSPAWQNIFLLSPDQPEAEFCDWLELITRTTIRDRTTWPDLELVCEPFEGWRAAALEMPCRDGPSMWEKLTVEEMREFVCGGDLPDDYEERGGVDTIH